MRDSAPRERKFAVFDKKKSIVNYMKLDDENENKVKNLKRLTSGANEIDINSIIDIDKESEANNLPKPPSFSGDTKVYSNNTDDPKLHIHQRATIINSFDNYESLDTELSLIPLENYLSKFDEEELADLTIKDILTFDLKEFDNIKEKLEEFKEIGKKLNDSKIDDFLNEKIRCVSENRKNIDLLVSNLDKIEDFVILNETLKFFFKKGKK